LKNVFRKASLKRSQCKSRRFRSWHIRASDENRACAAHTSQWKLFFKIFLKTKSENLNATLAQRISIKENAYSRNLTWLRWVFWTVIIPNFKRQDYLKIILRFTLIFGFLKRQNGSKEIPGNDICEDTKCSLSNYLVFFEVQITMLLKETLILIGQYLK